jgi:hypothetical protein
MAEMAPKLAVTTIPLREVQSYIPHRRQPFHLGDMTMKVLCISKWAKAPSPEERDAILPKEVPATLRLYLDGVIEQMWFKLDAPGVVFL